MLSMPAPLNSPVPSSSVSPTMTVPPTSTRTKSLGIHFFRACSVPCMVRQNTMLMIVQRMASTATRRAMPPCSAS